MARRTLKAQAIILRMLHGFRGLICGIPYLGLKRTGAVVVFKDAPRRAAGARCGSYIYVRVWEIDMLKKTKVESNVVIKMIAQGRGKALA